MGPVVVLVPGAPTGLFVVCLLGGAGGREVCPQRSLAPACPGGEKTASVQRRMLPIRVCGGTYTRQMQHGRDGQLVSLCVRWLEHTPKAMNRCFLRDWASQGVILLPYIWLSNLWAAVCHPDGRSSMAVYQILTHKTLKQPSTHKQLKLWPRNYRNPKFLLFQVHRDSVCNFMVI